MEDVTRFIDCGLVYQLDESAPFCSACDFMCIEENECLAPSSLPIPCAGSWHYIGEESSISLLDECNIMQ